MLAQPLHLLLSAMWWSYFKLGELKVIWTYDIRYSIIILVHIIVINYIQLLAFIKKKIEETENL